MEVYVEKLIVYEHTMMALVAKHTHFTSAPTLLDLPLNSDNNPSKQFLMPPYPETRFCNAYSSGTSNYIAKHVDHPMDDDNAHHDDCRWLINLSNLSALRHDIIQTFTLFSTFLGTLHPLQPVQPTLIPAPAPMDNNGDPPQPESHCHLADLLNLQQEVRQHMASAQTFSDSWSQMAAILYADTMPMTILADSTQNHHQPRW